MEPIQRNSPRQSSRESPMVEDYTCYQCGYILRGLRENGLCPECGEAIAASIDPSRLVRVEPARLRMMQRGLLGLIFSPGLCILGGLLGTALSAAPYLLILSAVVLAWILVSIHLLTVSPQPLELSQSSERTRIWVRRLGLATGALTVLTVFLQSRWAVLEALPIAAVMILCMSLTWATVSYAGVLAQGVDQRDVARNFEALTPWLIIMAMGVLVAALAIVLIALLNDVNEGTIDDVGCLVLILACLPVGVGILAGVTMLLAAWVILIRLAWALRRTIEQSTLLHGK